MRRVAFLNCLIDVCFIVLLCRPLNFFKLLIHVLSSMYYIVLCSTFMLEWCLSSYLYTSFNIKLTSFNYKYLVVCVLCIIFIVSKMNMKTITIKRQRL